MKSFHHFNVVIARCLVNLMAGTTLQCRDCVLRSVDPCITEQERVMLRSTSFLSDRLFDGQAKPVVACLEDSAQDFSLQRNQVHKVLGTGLSDQTTTVFSAQAGNRRPGGKSRFLGEKHVPPSGICSKVAPASDYASPPIPPTPLSQYPQVRGRLQDFCQAWATRGASVWIVSILREGYHLEFENPPPLSHGVSNYGHPRPRKDGDAPGTVQCPPKK